MRPPCIPPGTLAGFVGGIWEASRKSFVPVRIDDRLHWSESLSETLVLEGGEMTERPEQHPWWTGPVRVLYALAAFLGSAATVITALRGWDHI